MKSELFNKVVNIIKRHRFEDEDIININGEPCCEIKRFDYNGNQYAVMAAPDDVSDFRILRVTEYYEGVASEDEFCGALGQLKETEILAERKRNRLWRFAMAFLTLVTLVGVIWYAWFIYHYEVQERVFELLCYISFALSFWAANHFNSNKKLRLTRGIQIVVMALLFTALIFFLNNYWRYLYENAQFYWHRTPHDSCWYISLTSIMRKDFQYTNGIGVFRYLLVFAISVVGLIVDTFVQHIRCLSLN